MTHAATPRRPLLTAILLGGTLASGYACGWHHGFGPRRDDAGIPTATLLLAVEGHARSAERARADGDLDHARWAEQQAERFREMLAEREPGGPR